MRQEIEEALKDTREQQTVVGPLVELLVAHGWEIEQMVFGKSEWFVPKRPSEATKREKRQSFDGFPVDIAVFNSVKTKGDPNHLLFVIECKVEDETAGVNQLESYYVGEPHAVLGVLANSADPAAKAVFLYRSGDGTLITQRRVVNDLPSPGQKIAPDAVVLKYSDLVEPTPTVLRRVVSDLLDKTVANDSAVTRREEQLDQLCNLLLLKLESDREASSDQDQPVFFRALATDRQTGDAIRQRFSLFTGLYPGVFTEEDDKRLKLTDHSVAAVVDALAGLKLSELGVSSVSLAFQVLRSEALKQGEGQYFTPQAVIQSGVELMDLDWKDIVLDPACGTGGFLVEALVQMRQKRKNISEEQLSKWAQTHIFGVEKDPIGTKLTKAVMQIAGDGSAHCVRGDSIRTFLWPSEFPHLQDGSLADGRFTAIMTNPPFGQNLKVSAKDCRLESLKIAQNGGGDYRDTEIGIVFLERCYRLLRKGGKLGIVLPETYFFSPNYRYVREWIVGRMRPVVVANIPMEAFQGFCRAKTNFYVFEKIDEATDVSVAETVFLNARTCGIYKDGGPRFKTDPETGLRTDEIDNELAQQVSMYLSGKKTSGEVSVSLVESLQRDVIVPTYYDDRYTEEIKTLAGKLETELVSIGELIDDSKITVRGGHGSPSNDQRNGTVPYVKVSDIRGLRININPTNLIPVPVAERYWKGQDSGLKPYDLITPNRASSNIGEFSILLPGEEQVVLTKEVFVVRSTPSGRETGWDHFYLMWTLLLSAVREQWRRITLMQTNREDCGKRHREILLPVPKSPEWAAERSQAFRSYFTTLAEANEKLAVAVGKSEEGFIANVRGLTEIAE